MRAHGTERSVVAGMTVALLMASFPVPTFTWNIGGHSPVTDHSDKDLVAAIERMRWGRPRNLGFLSDGDSFSQETRSATVGDVAASFLPPNRLLLGSIGTLSFE